MALDLVGVLVNKSCSDRAGGPWCLEYLRDFGIIPVLVKEERPAWPKLSPQPYLSGARRFDLGSDRTPGKPTESNQDMNPIGKHARGPETKPGLLLRSIRSFRSFLWLCATYLPDRWHKRKESDGLPKAPTATHDYTPPTLVTKSMPPTRKVQPPWLGAPRTTIVADCLLLSLAIAATVACIASPHSIGRLLLLLAAACLVLGSALLTRLPVDDPIEAFGLAVGFGFCIEALGTLAMVWTGLVAPTLGPSP